MGRSRRRLATGDKVFRGTGHSRIAVRDKLIGQSSDGTEGRVFGRTTNGFQKGLPTAKIEEGNVSCGVPFFRP